MPILDRAKKAWNIFFVTPTNTTTRLYPNTANLGSSSSSRPDRVQLRFYNDKSLISSIYTRLSIDVAGVDIRHVLVDGEERYVSDVPSRLSECFKFEPNLDQTPRSFRQDAAMSLFDKGSIAIVAVDTTEDPDITDDFDVITLRVGEIITWYPRHVRVSLYNEERGIREEILLPKTQVAIVENPFYPVMNAPNSTLQRLIRKLQLLDSVDEATGSGKLDLIIQLPYVIKSEARQKQAEKRRDEIEFQLRESKYGIAYADGTEKITQLNRPVENNLLKQIEFLTDSLFSQLGLTLEIMNGSADEKTMLNYYNRTIEPVLDSIVEAVQKTFVGIAKFKKNERIMYFRDPFKFVPLGSLADIIDKLSRNEIFSANEVRQFIGVKPSKDPKADKLLNSNMPQPQDAQPLIPVSSN